MQANQLEQSNRLMGNLLRLEKRLRAAESPQVIRFIAVNETLALVSFEQAAIGASKGGVKLLSGLSEPDLNAPYVNWLKQLFRHLGSADELRFVTSTDLPEKLRSGWQEWLPGYLAALPVAGEWLLLARQQPFAPSEQQLLTDWSALLSFHLRVKKRRDLKLPSWFSIFRSPILWLGAVVIMSLFTKVPLSVLAPAEIVAQQPGLVRAPLDAVVADVLVEPNQFVQAGELLFRFDDRNLLNDLALAEQRIATAQSAYRQAAQQALVDLDSKNRLVLLQSDIETAQLEVDYLRQLLMRTEVRAPITGQVLIQSRQEWLGRPVNLGERMVEIADPSRVEIKAWLSPSDQVPLEVGSRVTLFDNSRPDMELNGTFISIGYQVEERADSSYAFPVKATLEQTQYLPPIGSRGTLRLESDQVSLAYLVMRRPLALLRQWLGV